MYIKIIKLDKVDSTNDYASKAALYGAREITVVSAKTQHLGKGRMGRRWVSVPGKGIYASFLLRPHNSIKEINYLPLFSALATARFLENILCKECKKNKHAEKVKIKIKLPNDIMVNDKKAVGILVEAKTTGKKPNFVVVGIGVNINSLKDELPEHATSLFLETGQKYDIEKIFPKLIKEMVSVYADFKKEKIGHLLKEVLTFNAGSSVEEIEEVFTSKNKTGEVVHFV
ncbi:MAG: biotin--[acetyl-CoA-carboxylase] ligase [Candidatus Omnitrophica bacterium]|nr:biotin--[acetyl-CoA-carboxylase] ligase [Candidatus Omnitrophota bacterium]